MTNILHLDHLVTRALCVALAALTSISCAAGLPTLIAAPGQPATGVGFVTAVQKSNGSRVVVRYKVSPASSVGVPVTVNLTFSAVNDAAANVRFTSDVGLRLIASQAPMPLPMGSSELEIQAVPESDGLFYINVFTTQNNATSAMSIAVGVGNGKPKLDSMGATKPSAAGEKIISIPVR